MIARMAVRRAIFGACGVLAAVVAWTYAREAVGAGPILDDWWCLVVYEDAGLVANLGREWTLPTYTAAVGEKTGSYAWGPLATSLQRFVAAVVTPGSVAPFRHLNTVVHVATAILVGCVTWNRARSGLVAVLVGAGFFVHPIAADAVPWASALFDVLGGLVAVLAMAAATAVSGAGAFAGVAFAGAMAAALCKPTLALAGAGVVAMARTRREAAGATAGTLVALLAHRAWYGAVVGETAVRLGDGPWWLAPAAVLAYLPDVLNPSADPTFLRPLDLGLDAPRIAGGLALAGLVAAFARREAGRGLLAFAVVAAPAAVFATWYGVRPLRYAYAPLAVAAPFLGAALATARPGRLALAGALVLSLWTARTLTRLPDWRSALQLFDADRRPGPGFDDADVLYFHTLWDASRDCYAARGWAHALGELEARQATRVLDVAYERELLAGVAAGCGATAE
jgi:hypothetical protein